MLNTNHVKGFTLIELLIVLVIMSLLLSLVPPLMSNVMPSVTIKASANDLYHDIKYVRNMAIMGGRQTSIFLNTRTSSYASKDKDNGKAISLPADVGVSIKDADVSDTDEDTNIIRFFADGSSSGASIILSTEDRKFTITVDWLTGKVSILEGNQDENA